jgi:phenylalanyl-tRNA synthetase alpha chain
MKIPWHRALVTRTTTRQSGTGYGAGAFRRKSVSSSAAADAARAELARYDLSHADCNVTTNIASRIGKHLHRQPLHPLYNIQQRIQNYWGNGFQVYDDLSPIVSTANNFDRLRIPSDHVSRSASDTYYLDRQTVLRTHTSAHQVDLLRAGANQFLVTGDVYRRDEIDRSHYPVFHQTEGVKMFANEVLSGMSETERIDWIERDLKQGLEGLAAHLFGPTEMRWVDAYFPFTHPSYELEILFQDEWLEVLGCGVIHPDIVTNAGRVGEQGWAFGLGLERLAMVLYEIPDIRLFWTEDARFHEQFASGEIVTFQPYSKFPACYKDMSFWIQPDFHVNDLNELVRDVAGDLVEQVELIDNFTNPKSMKTSHCYRISYRSMDRSLTNEEIDKLQEKVRNLTEKQLHVVLR